MSCISVIVCDDVYRDETTKKLVIVGTFNRINLAEFPARYHGFCVLFTITGGKGKYELSLSIDNDAIGSPILEVNGPIEINDPLQIQDINVHLQGIQFPEPGKYWVTIKADGAIINQRPFFVTKQEKSDSG